MKKVIAVSMLAFLLVASNLLADGDLIVDGNLGVGTTNPSAKLVIPADLSAGTSPVVLQKWVHSSSGSGGDISLAFTGADQSTVVGALRNYWASPDWITELSGYMQVQLSVGATPLPVLTVNSDGNVGIATPTPADRLHLYAGPNASYGTSGGITISDTNTAVRLWDSAGGADTGTLDLYTEGSQSVRIIASGVSYLNGGSVAIGATDPSGYRLYVNGDVYATSFHDASDIRLKKNVEPIADATTLVEGLQGVRFDWRVDEFPQKSLDAGRQIGLIAQDVETVLPEVVKTDTEGYKGVSYEKLTAVLVEAIKEQQIAIKALQKRLTEAEDAIATLTTR